MRPTPRELSGRFASSLFIHGGWLHLGGNMLYLWIFGDNVEDRLGHLRFLAFFLLSGFLATGAHVISAPESSEAVVGASGASAGVLGVYLVMFPGARVFILLPLFIFFPVISVPAVFALGFWFLEQVVSGTGALVESTASMNVAWWAHIGGFVAGMMVVRFFGGRRERFRPTRRRAAENSVRGVIQLLAAVGLFGRISGIHGFVARFGSWVSVLLSAEHIHQLDRFGRGWSKRR